MNKTLTQIQVELSRLNAQFHYLSNAIDTMQCYRGALSDDPEDEAQYEKLSGIISSLYDSCKPLRKRITHLEAERDCLETLPEFFSKRDALVKLPADASPQEVSAAVTFFLEARDAAIEAVFNRDSGIERTEFCSAKAVASKADRPQDLPAVTRGYKAIFSGGSDAYCYSTGYRAEFSPDLRLGVVTKVV